MWNFARANILGIVIITGLAISACRPIADDLVAGAEASSPISSSDCRTLQHQMGETKICGQPESIVVLGSPMLELLLALDIQPTGYSDPFMAYQGSYDNPDQHIPYLGSRVTSQPINIGSSFNPSIEAILKAQPDLILATHYSEAEYQIFSKLAPTLILEWFEADANLRTIAQAVGRPEEAEKQIAKKQQQIDTTRKAFAPIVEAYPNVLALGISKSSEISLMTAANGFCASLIEDLGFQLVYPPEIDGADPTVIPSISIEVLPQLNQADSIVVFGNNSSPLKQINRLNEHHLAAVKQAWETNEIAQSLEASKAGRVYFIPTYLCLGLPGPIGAELYLNELKEQLLAIVHLTAH